MYTYIESDNVAAPVLHSVRLLDQLRERIRYLHYSLPTEKAYLYWARFSSGGMPAMAPCVTLRTWASPRLR